MPLPARPSLLSALLCLLAVGPLAACAEELPPAPIPAVTPHVEQAPAPAAPPARSPLTGHTSVDETALDKTTAPCDDFYQYACGNWMKNNPVPDEERSWTRSFNVLQERNEKTLRDILERDAAGNGGTGAYARELGDYYGSCMDEAAAEKAGAAGLKPMLAKIAKVKDPKSLATVLGEMHLHGSDAVFSLDSGQDNKDATQVIGIVDEAGLGMPDRDYYLVDEPSKLKIRAAYLAHVEAMFKLLGDDPKVAAANAAVVYAFEKALAQASFSKIDRRDPQKTYHRIDRAGLVLDAPEMPWGLYFAAVGAPDVTALNVVNRGFMTAVNGLLSASPVCPKPLAADGTCPGAAKAKPHFPAAEWQTYLRFHLVGPLAPGLSAAFVDESFKMEQQFTGAKTQRPRWKRCVRATDRAMGEALARPFVETTLGDAGKKSVKDMVARIEAAMHDKLEHLAWMDPPTRAKALEKLAAIANKIAYPDRWRSYDGLVVTRGDYLGNRLNAAAFESRRRLAKIGKPLDRNEWDMTPPTVNAYYDPSMNEMVFPAGILQPPFFAGAATAGTNFGAIGMVIGHELTHGFDDEGRQFDGAGNMREWWTPGVAAEFDGRAACVVKQFDDYVLPSTTGGADIRVKGKLTLGENIADLGGLRLSYAAFEKELADRNVTEAGAFTDEQQFFLAFAQAWCTNMREESLRAQVQSNPHAPPRLRVNGPTSNMREFADAFSCKPGSAMVRTNRCEVW